MPAGITLVFNEEASARVAALWGRLAAAGLSDSQPRLGYRPHLTLLVHDAPPDHAARLLPASLAQLPRAITLVGPGLVAEEPATLWLAAVPDPALMGLHAHLAARAAGAIHPHYRPGSWVPHVTLATGLPRPRLPDALACLDGAALAFTAPVAAIEAVGFPPVQVQATLPRA